MTDVYKSRYVFEETHVCFVCGDTIELTAQVCSRFCMRALEQLTELDKLDNLEAQVESPKHSLSDYEGSSQHLKIVPEQRSEPQLTEVEAEIETETETDVVPGYTTY